MCLLDRIVAGRALFEFRFVMFVVPGEAWVVPEYAWVVPG